MKSSAKIPHPEGNGNGGDTLETRVTRVEVKVDHMQIDISEIKANLKRLDEKIEDKYSLLDHKIDREFYLLDNKIDALEGKFEHRFEKIDLRFNSIEATLNQLVANVSWIQYGMLVMTSAALVAILKLFWHSIV